jgi:hypothetical protein
MGNVTSSLRVGNLANALDEAKFDPAAILDSFNIHGRKFASSLSDTMRDTKQGPSALLGSPLAFGRSITASLSNTAIGASPLIAKLLDSSGKYWHRVLALLPISRKPLYRTLFSITINFYRGKHHPSRCVLVDAVYGYYCHFMALWRVW